MANLGEHQRIMANSLARILRGKFPGSWPQANIGE
jgi:hypothetical protein